MSPLIPKLPLVPITLRPLPLRVPLIPKVSILPAPITVPSILPKYTLPLLPPLLPPIIAPFYPVPYTLLPFIPQFSRAPLPSLKRFKKHFFGKRTLLKRALDADLKQ